MRRGKLKDEVDKSRVVSKEAKLMWLDYVQSVIYRSCDHNFTIAFPLRHELPWTYRYECSLVKNLPTNVGDWREKPED